MTWFPGTGIARTRANPAARQVRTMFRPRRPCHRVPHRTVNRGPERTATVTPPVQTHRRDIVSQVIGAGALAGGRALVPDTSAPVRS